MTMTLGENLQALRRAAGLSQEEVAGRLFVSRQSVSKWELGQAEPGVENLKALTELYGVTMDQLIGRTTQTEAPEPDPIPPGTVALDLREEREKQAVSYYRTVFGARTALFILHNLLVALPAGGLNFPFDWIFMLVGLGVRKAWVYWLIVVFDGIGLVASAAVLFADNLAAILGLAFGSIFLFLCTRKGARNYFHMT